MPAFTESRRSNQERLRELVIAHNLLRMTLRTSTNNVDPMKQVTLATPSVFKVVVKKIVREVEKDVHGEIITGTMVLVWIAFTSRAPTAVT